MRNAQHAVLATLLLCAGCKSSVDDGYAIDLTVIADSSVSDDALARAATLDLEVSGADTYSDSSLPVAGKFDPRTRSAGLRYKPKATTGSLTIRITIADSDGNPLAMGALDSVQLHGGTQLLSLTLSGVVMNADGGGNDFGASDLAGADLASTDLALTPDMVFVPSLVPSCVGLASNCGAGLNDSCCASPVVTGGTFKRSYDVAVDGAFPDQSNPATVSDFRLDRYEITVGRFRKFVSAGAGTQANPPAAGAGANPYLANSGWSSTFNSNLATDSAALAAALKCYSGLQTWTDAAGSNEDEPINCVSWFEAFAFCAWDGGFLPTEAEWNYAASGGSEQRAYPWSNPPASVAIDCSYANYDIDNPSGTHCVNGTGAANNVGSESPKGDGKWGQSDLTGNVAEWNLDWYAAYANPCTDCADLTAATYRVVRGGGFSSAGSIVRAAYRGELNPLIVGGVTRDPATGFRCARAK